MVYMIKVPQCSGTYKCENIHKDTEL